MSSSIDWCEKNYVYSLYIAEFFNTISSFSMVIAGLLLHNPKPVMSLTVLKFLIILVGLGSILFHSNLTRFTQALDEVPMIWTVLALMYNCNKRWFNMYIIYGILSSITIVYSHNNIQFYLFHLLNTFITISCIYVLYNKSIHTYRYNLFKKGVCSFGIGITCWILDLFFCDYVQPYNLHAFWHIFSSIGFYYAAKVTLPH